MVGPGSTPKHRPPYVDSLTGGTASWFLLTDLRQCRDDETYRHKDMLIATGAK